MQTNPREQLSKLLQALLPIVLLCSSCQPKIELRNRTVENSFPKVILWAWERPENLEFLDPQRFGVAFLAQTLELQGEEELSFVRADYLGRQTIAWARTTPDDPRVPEAQFITARANSSYKCGARIGRRRTSAGNKPKQSCAPRYAESAWTAKLNAVEN